MRRFASIRRHRLVGDASDESAEMRGAITPAHLGRRDERAGVLGDTYQCVQRRPYADAGADTPPESVPWYSPVARFATPLVFAMPVAPAKRPVPPVITPGSSYRTFVPAGTARPAKVPYSLSPFA